MKWELLKTEIKSVTVQYCTFKNKNNFSEEKRLSHELKRISTLLIEKPHSNQLQEELSVLRQKIEIFTLNKAKGAQIRSRVKYIEKAEQNTIFFWV